jgi:uncharacterized membrane protein YeiH
MSVLSALDFTAVLVFAISGALAASRAQLDLVGFAFVACLTAVGGGTIRDLLLNRDAVFWVVEPTYIFLAASMALVVFFTAHKFESRLKTLMWVDACALAVAVVAGSGVALSLGQPAVIVVLMGITTGCFGGLMRDVVCNEVPLVLKQGELYASAAFLGALSMVCAHLIGLPLTWSYIICGVMTFALRAGSLAFGWSLPVYKTRAPRN